MNVAILKILDFYQVDIDKMIKYISEEKKKKINGFYKIEDKVRGIYSELLIRKMIMEELNIENKEIFFKTNKYGKPYLKGFKDIFFNISHSGQYVVCCLDSNPVGIDIEKISSIDFEGIAKEFFTFKEQEYILKENKLEERINRFYEIWTFKESFIKCIGTGLYVPLNSFSICFDEENKPVVDINKYSLKRIEVDKNYKMSICSPNNNLSYNIKYISSKELKI